MSEDWKIQVSPKTKSGTLINIRGNTVEEVRQLITDMTDLALTVVGLEEAFGAVHNLAPLSTGGFTGTPQEAPSSNTGFPSTPPVAQAPQSGSTCLHGARTFKSGTGSNGRPWTAWMCPTPKGTPNQCQPVWG